MLYTYSNKSGDKGIQTVINATETVTGTLKSFTEGKSLKVGDTTYKGTDKYKGEIKDLTNAVDQEVTVYLDQYGYVVYVDTDTISGNYAVVLKKASGINEEAKLLFTDGTTATVNVSKYVGTIDQYDIVSYTKNSSGDYKLTLIADKATAGTARPLVENGKSDLTNIDAYSNAYTTTNKAGTVDKVTADYANGKTIFLVMTSGTDGYEYKAYVGIKNVPDIKASQSGVTVTTYVKDASGSPKTGAATVIFIDASDKDKVSVSGSSSDIVFIKGNPKHNVDGTGSSYRRELGNYWEYDAIVNGEFTTIKTSSPVTSNFALYNDISYSSKGVATKLDITNAKEVISGTGTERVKNDVVGLNGKYYTYSKDCQVFHIDEDGDFDETAYTVSNIATDDDDNVWFVIDSGDVVAIFYQDVTKGGNNNKYDTNVTKIALSATTGNLAVFVDNAPEKDTPYTVTLSILRDSGYVKVGTFVVTVKANATDGKVDISDSLIKGNSYQITYGDLVATTGYQGK